MALNFINDDMGPFRCPGMPVVDVTGNLMRDLQIRDAIDKQLATFGRFGTQYLVNAVQGFSGPWNARYQGNHFIWNLLKTE